MTLSSLDLPLSQWGTVLNEFEDRTLFQTPAWLSFVAASQRAQPVLAVLTDGASRVGYFSGLMISRWGIKILGSPLPGWTTSYMGLNLLPGVDRGAAVMALRRFAFREMGCVHLEVMDRRLSMDDIRTRELKVRPFRGYEIDLSRSERELWANMSSACRRCVRQARNRGVTIEEARDEGFVEEYHQQLRAVFRRQGLVPSYGVERVRNLMACLHDTGMLLCLRARDGAGRSLATAIFPAMNGTMYFWGGASWREGQRYRPNELLHWHAMNYWKARGMVRYDMGGGGAYKRKFGGAEIMVPWIRSSRYPGLEVMRRVACRVMAWHRRRATLATEGQA